MNNASHMDPNLEGSACAYIPLPITANMSEQEGEGQGLIITTVNAEMKLFPLIHHVNIITCILFNISQHQITLSSLVYDDWWMLLEKKRI